MRKLLAKHFLHPTPYTLVPQAPRAIPLYKYQMTIINLLRSFTSFVGPGFIISVAYMDPGNWAANLTAGTDYGTALLWVVVGASLMAMFIQVIAAKLGVATERGIAALCREQYSKSTTYLLWAAAELAMIATDVAEILGTAIGFSLVLKLPLWVGAVLAAACAFLLLGLRSSIPQGYRVIEYIIMVLVAIVSVSFIYLIVVTKPSARSVGEGLIPSIPSVDALYIAMSMIGATIMPHSVYLHPSIVQDRRKYLVLSQGDSEDVHRRHIRFESADTIIALFAAMFVNGSMVIVASACLFQSGISSIEEAFELIEKTVGNNVSTIFGAALIISGLASSVVCTMAGQEVMDGFLNWKVHVWIRRSVTLVPSLIIVLAELNPTKVLVASQVALSFELPFVLIPLYMFTKDRDLMGPFVNGRITILLFFVFLSLLVGLNIWLLVSAIFG